MKNIRDYGCDPNATPETNTNGLVESIKQREGIYGPSGKYRINPIHRGLFDSSEETAYCDILGDGHKQTIFAAAGDSDIGLFDWDGLMHFDTTVQKIGVEGSYVSCPFLWRYTAMNNHYRLSMRDVRFSTNVGGDGLCIGGSLVATLDNVISYRNSGWGIRIEGTLSVCANNLGVERNLKGGILWTADGLPYREACNSVINMIAFEDDETVTENKPPALRVEEVYGLRVTSPGYRVKLEFANGAHDNEVDGAVQSHVVFEDCWNNSVFGTGTCEDTTERNYMGCKGGLPMQVPAIIEISDPPLAVLTKERDRIGQRFQVQEGLRKFQVDYSCYGGYWYAYLSKDINNETKYYDWKTEEFTAGSTNTRFYAGWLGHGRVNIPFKMSEEGEVSCVIVNYATHRKAVIHKMEVV